MLLYSWNSPNAEKIHIALEELEIDCEIRPVNLGRGEQRDPEFLLVSPAAQVPVLEDRRGGEQILIHDSSAILIYLAELAPGLIPDDLSGRFRALSWLSYQGASIAPIFGFFHELFTSEDASVPAVLRRLQHRVERAYQVVERSLSEDYLAGSYSIADIACWCWLREPERVGVDRELYPRLSGWIDRVSEREAVQRGVASVERLTD